jgi:trans-L-3-hydroxyproline dehydratase
MPKYLYTYMQYMVSLSGYPQVLGGTILEKLSYVRSHLDHLRSMLMCEPRGHTDMYGALLVEKDLEEADMAVIFTHSEGKIN